MLPGQIYGIIVGLGSVVSREDPGDVWGQDLHHGVEETSPGRRVGTP
jgi:hypothetical protein